MRNKNLADARNKKNDEFYTIFETIESEVNHYTNKFKDKIVFCNCDDPELFKEFDGSIVWQDMLNKAILEKNKDLLKEANNFFREKNINDFEERASQFWLYFHKNFSTLGLKELIATHYNKENKRTYGMRYKGGNDFDIYDFEPIWFENSNGDFRSDECVELLKYSDIVVTNPPFSHFIEYINQLIEFDKLFLVIGNIISITCKDIFPLIKNNKVWWGKTQPKKYKIPENTEFDAKKMKRDNKGYLYQIFGNHTWYTNINFNNREKEFYPLNHLYYGSESKYNKYENYDAINVNAIKKIPKDYYGNMGVPISILSYWNPNQFEIIGLSCKPHINTIPNEKGKTEPIYYLRNNEKIRPFKRLIIKRK